MIGGLRPFEGPGILVVSIDEGVDIGLELPDRGVDTSSEPFSGELGKPALDLIDGGHYGRIIELAGHVATDNIEPSGSRSLKQKFQ